jgi:hypothetical protein
MGHEYCGIVEEVGNAKQGKSTGEVRKKQGSFSLKFHFRRARQSVWKLELRLKHSENTSAGVKGKLQRPQIY